MSDVLYDKEDIFESQMMPLVNQLRAIAEEHGIPFLVAISYMSETVNEHQGNFGMLVGNSFPDDITWTPSTMLIASQVLKQPMRDKDEGDSPYGTFGWHV